MYYSTLEWKVGIQSQLKFGVSCRLTPIRWGMTPISRALNLALAFTATGPSRSLNCWTQILSIPFSSSSLIMENVGFQMLFTAQMSLVNVKF